MFNAKVYRKIKECNCSVFHPLSPPMLQFYSQRTYNVQPIPRSVYTQGAIELPGCCGIRKNDPTLTSHLLNRH